MNISENIKSKRKDMGMSQSELAAAIGVSTSMVCQIERGTKAVSLQLGAEIAEVLECDIADLIV